MPQAASQVDIAYDWELWIGRTVNAVTTWTQIHGFEALPFPEQAPEDIDVTHMQSPGLTRETIPGLLPVADWSQEKQLWPGSAGDILLSALADLTEAGNKEDVLFEFNLDPEGASIRRTYRGYVNHYTPNGTVGDKAMGTLNVKIMERQPTNPRDIASTVAPSNTVLPAVSGIAQEGETLTALEGVWVGAFSFTYQWQEDGSGWANITGATSKTFVPVAGNINNPLRVIVTGVNSSGTTAATSAATAAVIGA